MGDSLNLHIEPLRSDHIQAAATMVAQRAMAMRRRFGGIRLTDPGEVSPLLQSFVGSDFAVVAEREGRLVGFIAAIPARLWGKPGGHVREYAFAANEPAVTRTLYAEVSARLAAADRYTHGVSLWADADDRVWHDFGFGRVVTEVVQELKPTPGRVTGIRMAEVEDALIVADLDYRLHRYLEAAPVFLPKRRAPDVGTVEHRITKGTAPVFIASDGSADIGYVALDPEAAESVALTGDEIVHCNGAFVVEDSRRDGTGSRLVAAASNWALETGYTALALDFETANTMAAAFWPKMGFTPVVHSLRRTFA